MCDDEERKLANFKDDVLAAYTKHKLPTSNMTKEERDELARLRKDTSTVIKPSDKSKKLVTLKQKLYLEKADALLSDSAMYEKVDITITEFESRVKAVLGDKCKNMDSKLLRSDGVHPSVRKAIRKHRLPVRMAYEHAGSLKRQFSHSAQSPPSCIKEPNIRKTKRRGRPMGPCQTCKSGGVKICLRRNVIYRLQCELRREKYIGETGRTLETRLEEHNGEARRHTVDKPWGDHRRAKHAGINLSVRDSIFWAVLVIARPSDRASRKLREAVEIRNEGPEVNTSAGWSLLFNSHTSPVI